jgi:hypothetical protein
MKTLRTLTATAAGAALTMATHSALACAACSGQSDSDMAKGMNAGIYVMLGMIGAVLCGASTFFVFLARRSAAVAKAKHDHNPSV